MARTPSREAINSALEKSKLVTFITDIARKCDRFILNITLDMDRLWADTTLLANDLQRLTMIRASLKTVEKWAADQAKKFDGDIAINLAAFQDNKTTVQIDDRVLQVCLRPGRTTTRLDDIKVKEFMVSKGIPPEQVAKIWKQATTESTGLPFIEVREIKPKQPK